MKTIRISLFLVVLTTVLSSCYKRNVFAVRGKGADVTETRSAGNFEFIRIAVDGEVEYTQDSIYKIEITGQQNILAVTKSDVGSGILKIYFSGNVWDHHPLKIRIHSPKIQGLEITGSANITAKNALTTDALNCDISGSGNIQIPGLTCKNFSGNLSGSGNISVDAGTTNAENLVISGSGNINCGNFISAISKCKISGSGNITTNVKDDLNAIISGSGDIRYRGKPAVNTQISGSGNLVHLD